LGKPARLTRVALVAAIYAVLTLMPPFSSLSYGPVQVRVAEALTVLPFISGFYAWGLFVGCIVANLGSPYLVYDVVLGSLATLAAGLLTARMPRPYLAPLPPMIINAVVVGWYVGVLSDLPYITTAAYILAGEFVACFAIGYPLLLYILRNERLRGFFS
jgi:uncharacterized membrane protein